MANSKFLRISNDSGGSLRWGGMRDLAVLYLFHQWQANLRILDVEAIKTVPYAPRSHPFVERLIGTIRRECLDSHALLDGHRSGVEAPGVPALLQWSSRSCGAERAYAGPELG
jgi:hypothetical protein